jgi:GTP cyclohydrolase II
MMAILTAGGLAAASQTDIEILKESEMHVPVKEIRPQLEVLAKAPLPTRHGTFEMQVFRYHQEEAPTGLSNEHVALVMGQLHGRSHVPVRIHSECLTSEVFGSLKCDCKDQLEAAQAEIARRGFGAVVYLRQEGRGIGLANKVRAYALQAHGADTVDANRLLGLPDDARRYDAAAAILANLGVSSVEILTNNPAKEEALRALGVDVVRRIPVLVPTNPFSAGYLETKRSRMRHVIPVDAGVLPLAANGRSGRG